MSDKSSTTNSLPNSPIHASTPGANNNGCSNNSPSLLTSSNSNSSTGLLNCTNNSNGNVSNNNNGSGLSNGPASLCNANGNNNNNTCSANRNVVDNESTCFRMDTDVVAFGEKEPDPDNIKMFVGQVPKSMDETQLREMFEEYGPVHSINVLRDKATGISKGKCGGESTS